MLYLFFRCNDCFGLSAYRNKSGKKDNKYIKADVFRFASGNVEDNGKCH